MKRGEIWWADLELPAGRHPVVLLSRDEAYEIRSLVMVCQVTTRVRGLPVEVHLGKEVGLEKPSILNPDYIQTISKDVLEKKIGRLTCEQTAALNRALRFTLGLDE